MLRAIHDPLAVGREERPAVVSNLLRQPTGVGPIQIHRVDIQIPVTHRGPDDRLAVGRDRGLGVVPRRVRQTLRVQPVDPDGEEIVVIQRPAIGPSVTLRLRRTVGPSQVGGRVQDSAIAGEKIPAGRGAGTGADHPNLFAPEIHHVHLITAERDVGRMHSRGKRVFHPIVRRLEDEFIPAERKIGLGILSAECQLPDIRQMPLGRGGRIRRCLRRLRFGCSRQNR